VIKIADVVYRRGLDDEELDSGDDEGRTDRAQDEGDATQYEDIERLAMDVEFQRQPVPEPTDGEVRSTLSCTSFAVTDLFPIAVPAQNPTLPRH
jgi:hypothetical protein